MSVRKKGKGRKSRSVRDVNETPKSQKGGGLAKSWGNKRIKLAVEGLQQILV